MRRVRRESPLEFFGSIIFAMFACAALLLVGVMLVAGVAAFFKLLGGLT